jgi:hypothetical protein
VLTQLAEIGVSWIAGGLIFARWARQQPDGQSGRVKVLTLWITVGFFLIFGCAVVIDLPEPLFWAMLVWIAPFLIASMGLTALVPVALVLMLLDALIFTRWAGAQAKLMPAFEGMLSSLFEDRPKSKHKRKPKIKRKNDWL